MMFSAFYEFLMSNAHVISVYCELHRTEMVNAAERNFFLSFVVQIKLRLIEILFEDEKESVFMRRSLGSSGVVW